MEKALTITIEKRADNEEWDINVFTRIPSDIDDDYMQNGLIDGAICTSSMRNAIDMACDMAHVINKDNNFAERYKTKTAAEQKLERINHEVNSANLCPECGSKETYQNSCGELQCDNCGYESNDLEDYD